MTRVLHLIASLDRGGAETALLRLVTAATSEQHRIVTVRGGTMIPELVDRGGDLLDLHVGRGRALAALPSRVMRAIAEYRPDILHAWMYHAGVIAGLLPARLPLVIGVRHGLDSHIGQKLRTRFVIRALAPITWRAAAMVYPSERTRIQHEMIGYSKRRAFVIPNGFDGDVFWPDRKTRVEMRAALGVEPSDLVLGHVARFHPVKNQLALVRCFSMVAKIRPRIRLLLAGDGLGEENVALEKEISQSGLARERFLLLGRRGDIPQVLTAVDGFVLPSLSEAFPNSLVEAMCSGLVSIASDVGEARKILGATDFLIPPQDNWALCDAIERWADLDESTRKKQGASARESVLARYSTSQFGKNYSEMYQAIATRAAHSFGGAY